MEHPDRQIHLVVCENCRIQHFDTISDFHCINKPDSTVHHVFRVGVRIHWRRCCRRFRYKGGKLFGLLPRAARVRTEPLHPSDSSRLKWFSCTNVWISICPETYGPARLGGDPQSWMVVCTHKFMRIRFRQIFNIIWNGSAVDFGHETCQSWHYKSPKSGLISDNHFISRVCLYRVVHQIENKL